MEKKEKSNNSYQENNININMNNDDTSNKADILLTKIALDAIIKELNEYKKNYIHKKNFIHLQKVNEELIEENKKLLLKIEELENKLNIKEKNEIENDELEKIKKNYDEKILKLIEIINNNEEEKKQLTSQVDNLNETLKEKEELINKQKFIINIYHKTNFESNKKFAQNQQVIHNIITQNPILNSEENNKNNLNQSITDYNDSEATVPTEQLKDLNLKK